MRKIVLILATVALSVVATASPAWSAEGGANRPVSARLPLSVGGLVVAATMTLRSARRAGRQAGVLPWPALVLGLGASLAANVAAAERNVVGRLVAASPPVALASSIGLLLRQTRGER